MRSSVVTASLLMGLVATGPAWSAPKADAGLPDEVVLKVKDAMISALISNMQSEGNRYYRIKSVSVSP